MSFLDFKQQLAIFPIFSIRDIRKLFPVFDGHRLVQWQNKKYIQKIRRGYYHFTDTVIDSNFIFATANKIYAPSYLSLETGLAFYGFIPEGVFTTVSVTTRNTNEFETKIGVFKYRSLKKNLFFGYRIITKNNLTFKIAEPEKLILDYFYLNTVNTRAAIVELRFNKIEIQNTINRDKLSKYQKVFNSRILDKRMKQFLKVIYA